MDRRLGWGAGAFIGTLHLLRSCAVVQGGGQKKSSKLILIVLHPPTPILILLHIHTTCNIHVCVTKRSPHLLRQRGQQPRRAEACSAQTPDPEHDRMDCGPPVPSLTLAHAVCLQMAQTLGIAGSFIEEYTDNFEHICKKVILVMYNNINKL